MSRLTTYALMVYDQACMPISVDKKYPNLPQPISVNHASNLICTDTTCPDCPWYGYNQRKFLDEFEPVAQSLVKKTKGDHP